MIYEHDGGDDSEWMDDFGDNDETVPKAKIEAALEWVDEIVARRCLGNWVGEWWKLN
ncbi:hypothetical protein TA3x_000543 [Tundrisphaera sp. TA3]|uniref:hypothetical protein n=1 Tax=Tundrisphaera sp. TA3 TaxID=3435775 RepID=UPI003EBDF86D